MEVVLGTKFTPEWEGVPPHMSSGDYFIWQRYLPLHREEYKAFYYDVRLIPDMEIPEDVAPELARMWRFNNAKRIDALGITPTEVRIIEVRVNAGAGALGAIEMYLDLWQQNPPLPLPVRGIIMTERPDPTMADMAKRRGIEVIEA